MSIPSRTSCLALERSLFIITEDTTPVARSTFSFPPPELLLRPTTGFPIGHPRTLHSALNRQLKSLNRSNVTADAKYRALQTATAMRTENPGMYIYSVGLGTNVDQAFLQQIANDPEIGKASCRERV